MSYASHHSILRCWCFVLITVFRRSEVHSYCSPPDDDNTGSNNNNNGPAENSTAYTGCMYEQDPYANPDNYDQEHFKKGFYGGYYAILQHPHNLHYVHGRLQMPRKDYYLERHFNIKRNENTTVLDYYFGYALEQMSNGIHRYNKVFSYFNNFAEDEENNRSIMWNQTLSSADISECHPNATYLCLENSETVCLNNGTIYCMTLSNHVALCGDGDNGGYACLNSTVPCVMDCHGQGGEFVTVALPCLSMTRIEDVLEDNKGMTLTRVGGTFALVPVKEEVETTYCVSVIADPSNDTVPIASN